MKLRSDDRVFGKMTETAARMGFLYGILCGAIAGFPIFGIGAMIGMPIGAIAGIVSGIVSSFALSAATLLFFNPLREIGRFQYRIVAALVSLSVSTVADAILIQGIFHLDSNVSGFNLAYIFVFVMLPVFLATLRCSQGLADVYIKAATISPITAK